MFFTPFFDYNTRYIVISDSELQEMKNQRLANEIDILESKVNRYEAALAEVKETLELKRNTYKRAGGSNEPTNKVIQESGASSNA